MKKLQRPPALLSNRMGSMCLHCLHRNGQVSLSKSARLSRQYSESTLPPSPPHTAFTRLASRRVISISGRDSTHYLQGVITTNLSSTALRTTGFYTAFLNAQGRLLNDVFIYPHSTGPDNDGWYIEVDTNEAERLLKHIMRYRLRAKFAARLLADEELAVWSLWDSGRERWTAHSMGGASGPSKYSEHECEDMRAPGMGRRLLIPEGKRPEADMDETDENAYRVRRYLKGVPEGQDELLREQALPQESNIDFMGGIDYRKGCYVGQELTIRTHHTGVVRKRILPIMIYEQAGDVPERLEYLPQTELDARAIPRETNFGRFEKKGRPAGKWLTGIGNIGLGLCRLEIMTDVVVQGEAGGYRNGDEFKLEWQPENSPVGLVKAKAFVPSWHLSKQPESR